MVSINHRNVYGEPLATCCTDPMTGFQRSGSCEVPPEDAGCHAVCARMTEAFLEFTKARGNDLSTPRQLFGFPGLKPGDRWCLCASRWQEALEAGCAPPVDLSATHEAALSHVSLGDLEKYAIDEDGEA
jgi:uncharacterized protein (DUF2237 family)